MGTQDLPELRSAEARFEYDQLRKEILQHQASFLQILGFTLAATGALVTVALRDANGLIQGVLLLFSQVILLFATTSHLWNSESSDILGCYLRVVTEKNLTFVTWETMNHVIRQQTAVSTNKGPLRNSWLWRVIVDLIDSYPAQMLAYWMLSFVFLLLVLLSPVLRLDSFFSGGAKLILSPTPVLISQTVIFLASAVIFTGTLFYSRQKVVNRKAAIDNFEREGKSLCTNTALSHL